MAPRMRKEPKGHVASTRASEPAEIAVRDRVSDASKVT